MYAYVFTYIYRIGAYMTLYICKKHLHSKTPFCVQYFAALGVKGQVELDFLWNKLASQKEQKLRKLEMQLQQLKVKAIE